ncbi:MAG TPA: PAS domain S-box protein [Steroidobacteraceae bacterium]|jgi:PAS domain S-box-containing protein|nr:PAS domain S-box protein [Steroidobacteraceae bacterium]
MKPIHSENPDNQTGESTGLFRIPVGELRPPVETLFRNTIDNAPIGIGFANRDGGFRHANLAFCAMLGFEVHELKKESIASLTHGADLEVTNAGLERLWQGEVTHLDLEKRYMRKDGGALWVRVTTSLVYGGGDQPECSVEFLRDISKRKEMAAALVQNQTLLATVFGELPLALLACDVRGQITHYNRAAAELFGISADDKVCKLPRNPYPLTSRVMRPDGKTPVPREERPLARTLRGETVSNAEFLIVRPDGVSRVVLANGLRLAGAAGQPLGAMAVVEDITRRREAEEELERVHKQLMLASRHAGMADVATNVLHNVGNVLNSVNVSANLVSDRIRQSKCTGLGRAAGLLNQHAGDLANFLAGPQGKHLPAYLQELAAELVAERDAAITELSELRNNVEHIKQIVAMQQSYAKRGGITDTVDVRVLAEDSLRMNEGAFSRHGVAIARDFGEVPVIEVDKHKVLQILVNVIRNAKYACSEAEGSEKRVTVRVRATASEVIIAVIDTGVGIPKENLERIFGHGFTTRSEGHGFGLHSSALAAQELGGSLRGESAGAGKGATFTLTLPLSRRESPDGK